MPVQMCLKIHQTQWIMKYAWEYFLFHLTLARARPSCNRSKTDVNFILLWVFYISCWQSSIVRSFHSILDKCISHFGVSRNDYIDWKIYVVFVYMLLNCKQPHWTEPNRAHSHQHGLCQWCDVNGIMIFFCHSVAPLPRRMRKEMGKIAPRIRFLVRFISKMLSLYLLTMFACSASISSPLISFSLSLSLSVGRCVCTNGANNLFLVLAGCTFWLPPHSNIARFHGTFHAYKMPNDEFHAIFWCVEVIVQIFLFRYSPGRSSKNSSARLGNFIDR